MPIEGEKDNVSKTIDDVKENHDDDLNAFMDEFERTTQGEDLRRQH